jgi:tetratricopeptide (TPR) repeat protein
MRLRKLPYLFAVAILFLLHVPHAQSIGFKAKPAKMMDEAFEKVDLADQASDDQAFQKAVSLYRSALETFNDISRDYPLWNPELLDLKRSYCEHQLSMALDELGGNTEVVPPPVSRPDPPPRESSLTGTSSPRVAETSREAELLKTIEALRAQLAAGIDSPVGERELVNEFNKLSREHNELQGEHSQLKARYEALQRERDSLDNDSSASSKDMRKLKKEIETLSKNGIQLLNDKKDLEKEVAILKAEKEELKKRLSPGQADLTSSASFSADDGARTTAAHHGTAGMMGPPSPVDSFAPTPAPPKAPPTQPAVNSSGEPVIFPSLAGRYTNQPPVRTTRQPVVSLPIHNDIKSLIKGGLFNQAIQAADEGLALQPGDKQLYLLKGMAGCRAGQFDLAVDTLQQLLVMDTTNEHGWVLLGTAQMALNNTWKASEAFHKALELNPNSPEANYNMAQILVSVDDLVAARECYTRCVRAGGRRDAALEKRLNP